MKYNDFRVCDICGVNTYCRPVITKEFQDKFGDVEDICESCDSNFTYKFSVGQERDMLFSILYALWSDPTNVETQKEAGRVLGVIGGLK